MRAPIFNPNVSLLKYGIREIVDTAQHLQKLDPSLRITWENIGDPIAKGWRVPPFLKEILMEEIQRGDDRSFGYTHSRGYVETRKWVCEYSRRFSPSSTLDPEYVLFGSGLGAVISALYHMLPKGSRIIQPTPSYPTHASMESFAAEQPSLAYRLDPDRGWEPDIAHLEEQLKMHPEIVGILVINPNNPTGTVYSRVVLEAIVDLAERYGVMIISDEIYFRMVYNGHEYVQITELAQGRVPLIVLRGLSKDVPWPGGRCGWAEFHNVDLNPEYRNYCESVKKRILMEVCSVSLPQIVLPRVYDHPDFAQWNQQYNQELEQNGNYIADVLGGAEALRVNRTNGAFYMMPLFQEGILNNRQTLSISHPAARLYIEEQVNRPDFPLDQRFTYYLLAATGICVVPASGFFSPYHGFRLTTLDRDEERRKKTYARLKEAVEEYTRFRGFFKNIDTSITREKDRL